MAIMGGRSHSFAKRSSRYLPHAAASKSVLLHLSSPLYPALGPPVPRPLLAHVIGIFVVVWLSRITVAHSCRVWMQICFIRVSGRVSDVVGIRWDGASAGARYPRAFRWRTEDDSDLAGPERPNVCDIHVESVAAAGTHQLRRRARPVPSTRRLRASGHGMKSIE